MATVSAKEWAISWAVSEDSASTITRTKRLGAGRNGAGRGRVSPRRVVASATRRTGPAPDRRPPGNLSDVLHVDQAPAGGGSDRTGQVAQALAGLGEPGGAASTAVRGAVAGGGVVGDRITCPDCSPPSLRPPLWIALEHVSVANLGPARPRSAPGPCALNEAQVAHHGPPTTVSLDSLLAVAHGASARIAQRIWGRRPRELAVRTSTARQRSASPSRAMPRSARWPITSRCRPSRWVICSSG